MARGFFHQGAIFPLMTLAYGLKVSGSENLSGLTGPLLFASNHHLGLDNPLIFKAVTRRWRRRLAVAAAAELWSNPIWWVLNPLLGNGFPIARTGPIRPSLENLGSIMDRGWSVLIYPEGVLTVGGPMKPFMQGAGLVAVEGRVPRRAHAAGRSKVRLTLSSPPPPPWTCRNPLRPSPHLPPRHRLPGRNLNHRGSCQSPLTAYPNPLSLDDTFA